jgi:hypothetical protein
VGKLDAMDQFASHINSDPTSLKLLQTQIAHAYPKEKGEDAYTSETITDSNGNQVAMPFNKKEGTYGTPSDQQQVTNGQAQWKSTIKPVAQQQQPQGNSQTVNNIINSDQQSGLQGQSNNESVKNNELEKQYRGNYRPFNDILDNPDLTAQAKLSAIRRIENSHNK